MGSKNCAETPRQKMISMMYLVLTALLALNVSKDILNAFVIVNESMEETNRIFKSKVDGNYALFEQAKAISPAKVAENYEKAMQVKKLANDLVAYIEDVKARLIAETEGISVEDARKIALRDVTKKDNYDITTNFFMGGTEDGSKGEGILLRNKIADFKKQLVAFLGKYAANVSLGLEVEKTYPNMDGMQQNWQVASFYRTILAADVVLLNKLIGDVRNAEADAVAMLYSAVSSEDFSFDKITAKVVPKSTFVMVGEEYYAEIFVAAIDSKQNPEIIIGSSVDSVTYQISGNPTTIEGKDGFGIYKVGASATGSQTYGGVIKVKSKSGAEMSYPFNQEYFVIAPTATVSADKMNVFYIGVPNPVSISVPGVPNDQVRAGISNGSLSGGNGKYVVNVTTVGECVISVSAEVNGATKPMGSTKFRVKKVPDPVPYIAGTRGGNVNKGALMANSVIIPVMENFDFDLNFVITSYTFSMNIGGDIIEKQGYGNVLTADMKNMISNAKRGQKVYIEDIKAKGPDGTVRPLGTINLKIL